MYDPVPQDLDFPALEQRVLRFWDATNAFEKLRRLRASSDKTFSFIDGPITANGYMGVHHAWGRTYKDLFQRYKAMTGHRQRYQNGFDCQGLWVEVEVEKELGFTSKRQIEEYGIGEFVQRCKERVLKFGRVISDQSVRLGQWMDWDDSYYTMSDANNYTIWRMIKTCHERGWLYRGHDVMPWCPRCGTGLSQHEIETDGYQDVTHTSLYVKLPLLDRPNENLLVWTTTPWTLTSNVAAAVHPELVYARATRDGQTVILAEPLVEKVLGKDWQVEQHLRGSELVGWRYRGPFDELPAQKGVEHRVIPWTEVSQEEGTGIVHIAPGCGEEDFLLGKEFGLPAIAPIDDSGVFLEGFGWLTDRQVQDVPEPIADDLRGKGVLLRAEPYRHRYPHCWRCDTQLVFRLVDEWYISMDELRHQMADVTRQIRWIPDFGLERELDWLRNMHDWMISKKRYWGLALPIWRCDACDRFEVVGGRDELRERAVEGWETFERHSPHRPYVDAVKIACGQCGQAISRIPDVGNPWLDAGIVPFSTLRYAADRAYWEEWFPGDFITESFPGQYRNWFYSLLVMSTVLEQKPPFLTVLGYGTLRGEDGRPMHKSWGNAIEFNEAANRIGSDVMRWIFALHNPAANLNFGWKIADETKSRLLTLWHSYSFFVLYARLENWAPRVPEPAKGPAISPTETRSLLDRWLLARLQALVALVRERLEDYDAMSASRAIEAFVEELSNWYIRRSRERFWAPGGHADPAALATLYETLVTLTKLVAPFMPFLAEELYQNLVRQVDADAPESVHHTDYPAPRSELVDADLVQKMEWTRLVASLGNAARKGAGIRNQQPLPAARVAGGSAFLDLPEDLVGLIKDELNVKRVEFARELSEAVRQRVEPNPKLLGPKYGKTYPAIRAALQQGNFTVDAEGRVHVRLNQSAAPDAATGSSSAKPSSSHATVWSPAGQGHGRSESDIVLEPEEATVSLEPAPGYASAVDRGVLVVLDTQLTPELIAEGRARQVVRMIQDARKAAGLDVADRIVVRYQAAEELEDVFRAHGDYVRRETLATELAPGADGADGWHRSEGTVDALPVMVALRKASTT